jgi:hypothetical protein
MPNLEAGTKEDWRIWIDSLEKISQMKLILLFPDMETLFPAEK